MSHSQFYFAWTTGRIGQVTALVFSRPWTVKPPRICVTSAQHCVFTFHHHQRSASCYVVHFARPGVFCAAARRG